MSREYRDLLVKAAPDGDEELEEKARGLIHGGSFGTARRLGRQMTRLDKRIGRANTKPKDANLYIRLSRARGYLLGRAPNGSRQGKRRLGNYR